MHPVSQLVPRQDEIAAALFRIYIRIHDGKRSSLVPCFLFIPENNVVLLKKHVYFQVVLLMNKLS